MRPKDMRFMLPACLVAALLRPSGAWEATPAIDFGAGGSTLGHVAFHAAVGVNHELVFLSGKIRGSGEFPFFATRTPLETMVDYGLLGGPFWNRSWGYFSLGSGISWQRFEERIGEPRDNPDCNGWLCADSLYDTRRLWVPGLPLEALAVFKLWFIGAGIRLYLNTNLHNSYGGTSLVIFLGGGATQRRDPRDEENR